MIYQIDCWILQTMLKETLLIGLLLGIGLGISFTILYIQLLKIGNIIYTKYKKGDGKK